MKIIIYRCDGCDRAITQGRSEGELRRYGWTTRNTGAGEREHFCQGCSEARVHGFAVAPWPRAARRRAPRTPTRTTLHQSGARPVIAKSKFVRSLPFVLALAFVAALTVLTVVIAPRAQAAASPAPVAFGDHCGEIGISVVPEGSGFRVYVDVPQTLTYYIFGNDGGGCGPQTLSGCPSWVVTTCQESRQVGPFSADTDFFVPNPGSGNELHIQCHGFEWSSDVAVIQGF